MAAKKTESIHSNGHGLYLRGVEAYVKGQARKLADILKSPSLDLHEKALLRARLLLRKRNWVGAQLALEIEMPDSFLEAEKFFVLGNTFGFTADWQKAAIHMLEAQQIYRQVNDARGVFLSAYNLSVDFSQLGQKKLSQHFLSLAEQYGKSPQEKTLILRAQACSMIENEQPKKALQLIDQALSVSGPITPAEKTMTLLVAAEIYFFNGQATESKRILQSLRLSKALRQPGRVIFELELLNRWLNEKSPYSTFGKAHLEVTKSSEHNLKWQILSNLQSGNQPEAERFWSLLQAHFPAIYSSHFSVKDPYHQGCLFFKMVESLLKISRVPSEVLIARPGKLQSLVQTLIESGSPVRKEILIERLWKTEYDPKFNSRLYKLIERARREIGVEIKNKNQSYYVAN